MEHSGLSCLDEIAAVMEAAKCGGESSSRSEGKVSASALQETVWANCLGECRALGGWQISRFTEIAGRAWEVGGGWLMEDVGFVAGGSWLEEAAKTLEEGREEGLGCTISATPDDEAVAFSTTLDAPE